MTCSTTLAVAKHGAVSLMSASAFAGSTSSTTATQTSSATAQHAQQQQHHQLSPASRAVATQRYWRRAQVIVDRIREGDLVLAMRDAESGAYVVCCLSLKMPYFVDSKTLDPSAQGRERFIGKVKRKNHCMAKKDTNRFNVPVGTKFYLFDLEYVRWRGASATTTSPRVMTPLQLAVTREAREAGKGVDQTDGALEASGEKISAESSDDDDDEGVDRDNAVMVNVEE